MKWDKFLSINIKMNALFAIFRYQKPDFSDIYQELDHKGGDNLQLAWAITSGLILPIILNCFCVIKMPQIVPNLFQFYYLMNQSFEHCHHQVLLLHQALQKSHFFFIHVPEYPQSTFFTNLVSLRAPVRVQWRQLWFHS